MKTLPLKTVTVLCLLMLFMGFLVKAQDVKPSKQETVEYIENYFKDRFFTDGNWDAGYSPTKSVWLGRKIKISDVTIADCTLTFNYTIATGTMTPDRDKWSNPENYLNQIDLSKVLSIHPTYIAPNENSGYALVFNEQDNPLNNNTALPFSNSVKNDAMNQTQIYKAFEHLRKLCGAPEPLKF